MRSEDPLSLYDECVGRYTRFRALLVEKLQPADLALVTPFLPDLGSDALGFISMLRPHVKRYHNELCIAISAGTAGQWDLFRGAVEAAAIESPLASEIQAAIARYKHDMPFQLLVARYLNAFFVMGCELERLTRRIGCAQQPH